MLTEELAFLFNNRGNAILARGDNVAAIASYRKALYFKPDHHSALSNLGNALRDTGQVSEAEAACRSALRLMPGFPEAWNNLGTALSAQGRGDEAADCFSSALKLRPDFPEARHNFYSGQLFNLLMNPEVGEHEILARHRAWGLSFPPVAASTRKVKALSADRPMRVGYLSADFREHAMRHYLEPALAHHDRSRVELTCYANSPISDEATRRLMGYGHAWVWTHTLGDQELAARIRSDEIDILVDCIGHTRGTRLDALASKPAPVMVSWLGYLGTTGLPAMDFRLTDAWVDPPGLTESQHTEKLLRLAGGMMAYRPHLHVPDANALPSQSSGRITFGSLNNLDKLNLGVVQTWAALLDVVPGSRLLLQTKALVDPGMSGHVRGMFEAFGIGRDRLELRPASADFLLTYHEIDVALDTFPYGGGATTCDALWMGVPVITCSGKRPAGRLTTSILHQIGRPQWAAETLQAYIEKARQVASDAASLAAERSRLRQRVQASTLCDGPGFARRLEQLLLSLLH